MKSPAPVAEAPLPGAETAVDPSATGQLDSAAGSADQAGSVSSPDESRDLDRPDGPVTIESLTDSLQRSLQDQNFQEALKFAEQALELEPDSMSLLFMASQLAEQLGAQTAQAGVDRQAANDFFIKSADFVRRILKSQENLADPQRQYVSQVFYNEACAYATRGENEKALASLSAAFDAGFDDFQLIDSDADLVDLRKTPEFTQLVAPRREEHQVRRMAEVKEQIAAQEPFAFDFDLVSTAGKKVTLADYKGKVLIVDFWGTWCPPCRKEIPHFVELLDKHRDAGLEIVGINYENGDPAGFNELINKFATENGVTYPCLLGDEVTQNRVPNLEGFPTTLFIDRSGKVRLRVVGYHPYDHLETIVQALLSETEGSTGG